MRSGLFLLLAFSAPNVDACIDPPFSCESHVESAKLLAIGVVRSEAPALQKLDGISDRSVLVEAVEVLIGEHSGTLLVPVMCFSPRPVVGERVVFGLYRDGGAWVYPAEYAEERLRDPWECALTMRSSGLRGESIVFPDVLSARSRLTRR
jgi:hypothetical protein